MKAAQRMAAQLLAAEPGIREFVRREFMASAVVTTGCQQLLIMLVANAHVHLDRPECGLVIINNKGHPPPLQWLCHVNAGHIEARPAPENGLPFPMYALVGPNVTRVGLHRCRGCTFTC